MITFNATIKKFGHQGEKTGWTYIEIPEAIAQQLMPDNKKSFRVKGKLDEYTFEGRSLVPTGGGDFILALNACKVLPKADEVLITQSCNRIQKNVWIFYMAQKLFGIYHFTEKPLQLFIIINFFRFLIQI